MKPSPSQSSLTLSRLWWEIPLLIILGICFLKGTNFLRADPELIECRAELADATADVAKLRRREEDGSLLKGLTAASFEVSVKSANEDVLKMSPKSMALQIEQLREIVNKYNAANKRLLSEKKQLAQDKERALDQLARRVVTSSADATDSHACESNLRSATLQASTLKDDLERLKTEQMTTKAKLDETTAQVKQSDKFVEDSHRESLELKAKLEQARVRINRLAQGTIQPRFFAPADKNDHGYNCQATNEDMKKYLKYTQGGVCPDDWLFVQHLIFDKSCFSLPGRKCRTPTPATSADPLPLPKSLFDQKALNDKNVKWEQHKCKSFKCLATQKQNAFNLTLEKAKWKAPRKGVIALEKVVALKKGTLRIGLDIGGSTGTFAAHMAQLGVTIVTTSVNKGDAGPSAKDQFSGFPYLEAIAARGLFPFHIPLSSRLPIFDGTLDIVHSSQWMRGTEFEDAKFEWDRVLRVGGILWLESFCGPKTEVNRVIAAIQRLGYKKLHWSASPKVESGPAEAPSVCINAVLEKQPVVAAKLNHVGSSSLPVKKLSVSSM